MTIIKSSINDLPLTVINALDSTNRGFFCSFMWFANFIKTVASPLGNDAFFFYEVDTKEPIILPVMLSAEGTLRVIRSLTNYYSPIYSVLNNTHTQHQLYEAEFFLKLKKKLPLWHIMELRPLSFDECNLLSSQLKIAGLPSIRFFCFGNWYMDVCGRSFNEYFSGLPSRLRNTVSRKSKKFFQLTGARVEIITTEQCLASGIATYQSVYNASWKNEEPFPEFVPGLMRLAASIHGLRLGIAYLDDRAIAVQFWIVADKTAYIFKLAYDEAYKQYSAGTILTTKLIEHAIDVDKVEVVDYLCGDDAYKKDWMSSRRERWGILVFNTSTVRGCIEFSKEMSKFHIKRLLDIFGNKSANKS